MAHNLEVTDKGHRINGENILSKLMLSFANLSQVTSKNFNETVVSNAMDYILGLEDEKRRTIENGDLFGYKSGRFTAFSGYF